jgi:MoaA/NifB/PqqE/SkfB family radical SAM enzyme
LKVEAGLRGIEKKFVDTVCLKPGKEKPSITKRIDNITEIRGEYLSEAPPCPESVKIELTALCNFSCAFCARSQRLREVGHIERSFYERILVDLLASGVEELGLFYLGESFLVPWLPDAIRYAKEIGFPYVFLTTNGSLSTPDKVEACLEAGLDSLKFSFNYSDPGHFATITRRPASLYSEIVTNLKAAWRVREEGSYTCGIYASYIMFEGERQREKMARVVDEIEDFTDEIYALPLYSQAAHIEREDGSRWVFTGGNPGRYDRMRAPIPCWALFTEGHITWDGRLSACCFDHDGRFHMGDLRRTSFMDAWHSAEFRALRAAHLRGDVVGTVCEQCVSCELERSRALGHETG